VAVPTSSIHSDTVTNVSDSETGNDWIYHHHHHHHHHYDHHSVSESHILEPRSQKYV